MFCPIDYSNSPIGETYMNQTNVTNRRIVESSNRRSLESSNRRLLESSNHRSMIVGAIFLLMSTLLSDMFLTKISETIRRKSVTTCSKWATSYRVMGGKYFPGPWSFTYHPWLREMHDCDCETVIGQKAAQMGFTEWAINRAFYKIDVENVDCLYVLPAQKPDANDFSSARFDPALQLSPYIGNLFSDVKNVGHKRAGNTNLYIRGAKSRSSLKSIPVGWIAFDEVAEMSEEATTLGELRVSGQKEKQILYLSTPDLDGFNINKLFLDSTQDHFHFTCPHCSRWTELIYPDCLKIYGEDPSDPEVLNSHLICKECHAKLDHETKTDWLSNNKWISAYPGKLERGFQISQLYSSTVRPSVIAIEHLKSLSDPIAMQELYNSRLGLPKITDGSRLTDNLINNCLGKYSRLEEYRGSNQLVTMGVDVGGTVLHYEIDQWLIDRNYNPADINTYATCRVLTFGKIYDFEQLDELMTKYKIMFAVIDAQPEKHSAMTFANKYYGRARICYYGAGVSKRDILPQIENNLAITVDRTSWLDCSLGRFKNQTITIPGDSTIEYKDQLKALVRKYSRDKDGNPTARYVKDNINDHFAHSRTYAEIALPLALGFGIVESIGNVL